MLPTRDNLSFLIHDHQKATYSRVLQSVTNIFGNYFSTIVEQKLEKTVGSNRPITCTHITIKFFFVPVSNQEIVNIINH